MTFPDTMRTCYTIVILLVAATSASAVCDQFSPFEPGQHPEPVPVVELTNFRNGNDADAREHCEFGQDTQASTILTLIFTTNGQYRISILSAVGSPALSFDIDGSPVGGADAYEVDLNADGIGD